MEEYLEDYETNPSPSTQPLQTAVVTLQEENSLLQKQNEQLKRRILDSENQLQKEVEFKRDELKVRSTEAENRKFELQLQKERQDQELAERKRMNNLIYTILEQKMSNIE